MSLVQGERGRAAVVAPPGKTELVEARQAQIREIRSQARKIRRGARALLQRAGALPEGDERRALVAHADMLVAGAQTMEADALALERTFAPRDQIKRMSWRFGG
jgi:hypothetical protein